MKVNPKVLNDVMAKAVGVKIEEEMKMVSRALYTIAKKYSFLFDGDVVKTQKMLIDACFVTDGPILDQGTSEGDEETIHFDMAAITDSIPEHMKEEIYTKIMDTFVTKLTVDDIK